MENSITVPQKNKNRTTIWAINFTSGYIPKRIEIRELKSYIYTHTHSSISHKSQKVKATQVPADRWMNKHNVCVCVCMCVYTQWNNIQVLKEGKYGTCYNMDES